MDIIRLYFYKNKVPKMQLVHRLVAKAFIPNPNNLPILNGVQVGTTTIMETEMRN